MEESTGIGASLPSEASSSSNSNSTASTTQSAIPMNANTADPLSFPSQNNMETYQNTPGHAEEVPSNERVIPLTELKAMLRQQLEYYFSRENLATDAYLRSQMDGDQYVPITTISRFNQIRRLTEDFNLVVEALRESPYVQVDEAGEKVRPSQRSIVLILREIPESTPIKDLEELFSGENCPKFSRCEFAHNDTWYVLFETDEDAKKAYCYLREEAKTFRGKPIMARIKASLTSAPYAHKNGVCTPQTTEAYNAQQMPQQQAQMQYTYANVPNENYNNQQICPPFYPPTMLQAWAPTTATCVDLGAVFSVNGLSPQTAYRPLPNTNKASYPVRERQVKAFSPQQSHINRTEQSSRYFSRSQSSYLARQQQQQQQPTFHSLMNASACSYDYMTYPSGSRNLHSFGCDVNFFTSPGVFFRKLQNHSSYPSHTAQVRHNPLLLPRNQMGVSAINAQDQSYIPVGSGMPYPKDAVTGAVSSISKQNSDSQGKENWGVKNRSKRWSKENGTGGSGRPFSENSNGFFSNKGMNGNDIKPESPKFDLEANSFPPLPGCLDDNILGGVDVYESRLSDIVKGTVKPSTRDTKTQTSESGAAASCALMKDSSTFTIEEPVITSDGAFTPPTSSVVSDGISNADQVLTSKKVEEWETFPAVTRSETRNDQSNSNSISTVDQTSNDNTATTTYSSHMNSVATNTPPIASLPSANSVVLPPATASSAASSVFESETVTNVPNSDTTEKQSAAAAKMPKVNKQADPSPKAKLAEAQSPKSKTPPESSVQKSKVDSSASKENKAPLPPKPQRAANFQNKPLESSLNKDKLVAESMPQPPVSAVDIGAPKNAADAFSPKDKVNQSSHPAKGRFLEPSKSLKGPETETNMSFLTVNGHADSESSVSSEDEKPFRKLTYSEVAMRAKDKVEKLAQELKEKERQEALVRHHRQQEIVAQGGPFREFPRRVGDRPPGTRDWRERRKPARAASLPSTGQ